MTFSQAPYQTAISRNDKIGEREASYYRQRLKHRFFANLIEKFASRAEQAGLTKAKLSILTGKDPATINRMLALPSNMTLDSISDLALALGCEPEISFEEFENHPRHNICHPWMDDLNKLIRIEIADQSPAYLTPLTNVYDGAAA